MSTSVPLSWMTVILMPPALIHLEIINVPVIVDSLEMERLVMVKKKTLTIGQCCILSIHLLTTQMLMSVSQVHITAILNQGV